MNEIFWIFVELTRMAKLKDFNGTLEKSKLWCQGWNALFVQADCFVSEYFVNSKEQIFFTVKHSTEKVFKSFKFFSDAFLKNLFENIHFGLFCWGWWAEAKSNLKTDEEEFWLQNFVWGSPLSVFHSFQTLYYSYMHFWSFKMLW